MSASDLTLEPLFQSCLSWSTVRQSTVRSLFVATAIPSLATTTSVYSTAPCSQTGTSSSGSIGREASEMSVSPAQNFSKPPPVPEVPTVIFTSGYSSLNSSAAASANGATVDEPSIAIWPLMSPPPSVEASVVEPPLPAASPSSSSPHAATPSASTPASASAMSPRFIATHPVLVRPHPCERDVKAPARAGIRSRSAYGRTGTPAGSGRASPAACGYTRRRSDRWSAVARPRPCCRAPRAARPGPGGATAPPAGRAPGRRAATCDLPRGRGDRAAGPPDRRPAAPRHRASAPSAGEAGVPPEPTGYLVVNGP